MPQSERDGTEDGDRQTEGKSETGNHRGLAREGTGRKAMARRRDGEWGGKRDGPGVGFGRLKRSCGLSGRLRAV